MDNKDNSNSPPNITQLLKNKNFAELGLESFLVSPIAYLRNEKLNKFDAPHQPNPKLQEQAVIELLPDISFTHALSDLASFSHIWLIWWFHKSKSWKPKVVPPRGQQKKRGVFATRSPHRFNPIGITVVPLLKIEGNKLIVGSNDLIDGTPILDIKPYLPQNDIIQNATSGWVGEVDAFENAATAHEISLSSLAAEQLDWFLSKRINFFERAKLLLEKDPLPHKTRRIKKIAENSYLMGCAGWRLHYTLEAAGSLNLEVDNLSLQSADKLQGHFKITISHFTSGYPQQNLVPEKSSKIVNFFEHLEFYKLWG